MGLAIIPNKSCKPYGAKTDRLFGETALTPMAVAVVGQVEIASSQEEKGSIFLPNFFSYHMWTRAGFFVSSSGGKVLKISLAF